MSLRINTNIEAFNAHRQLEGTQGMLQKSMEKLSSGLRINRAADDAAGLAISEKMRAQINGIAQAHQNSLDGISMVQTAEGALNEVHAILQRVRELAVEYNNGTLSSADRAAITVEITQLSAEVTRIVNTTQFNGIDLLSGSVPVTFQVGANAGETIVLSGANLGGTYFDSVFNGTFTPSSADITAIDNAVSAIADVRATLRRRAEPHRAHRLQPRHLPGEPVRRGEPHPRRRHGLRDGQLHEAADPLAVRHRHARPGEPAAPERPEAAPVNRRPRTSRDLRRYCITGGAGSPRRLPVHGQRRRSPASTSAASAARGSDLNLPPAAASLGIGGRSTFRGASGRRLRELAEAGCVLEGAQTPARRRAVDAAGGRRRPPPPRLRADVRRAAGVPRRGIRRPVGRRRSRRRRRARPRSRRSAARTSRCTASGTSRNGAR